ncbi:exo-1,3-beta-glucanase [Steccherinum ochraceum]|uniref:Exo-1,3-beta-glucanase n=1 Tax=Steccherinum ochraceum TaxID=92696 RepID=A0A4R0R371_9APHY|nr:exo-1,3-beta-glucanase [Steccherinum ochraceum]
MRLSCLRSFSFSFTASLLLLPLLVEAQQCRLVAPNALVASGKPSSASPTATPTGTSSGLPSGTPTTSSGPSPTLQPFAYGQDPIRGVNLGGWFVLEPWITPSIFQNTNNTGIIDEFTMGQMLDNSTALSILTNHWETWITEDDFAAIAAAGLNHVRIQLGYWSVPLTSSDTNGSTSVSPYIPGAWPYFLAALNLAHKHNLRTIVDLHGAPGSQNGFDNSGQRTGNPTWGNDDASIQRTLDTLKFIAEKAGGLIDVLELLNEPTAYRTGIEDVLRDFWMDGYQVVRNAVGTGMQVMIGDGFLGVDSWTDYMTPPTAQGVFMDFHQYQIFNADQIELSQSDHIQYSCQVLDDLRSFSQSNIFTVMGEWSNAITDCAKWLNGRGVGARWDGTWQPGMQTYGSCDGFTGSSANFSDDYKTYLRQYWESQVNIGEAIQGWVFWTWKAENADEWSYQKGLQGGWIPQDPTDRQYPNPCT